MFADLLRLPRSQEVARLRLAAVDRQLLGHRDAERTHQFPQLLEQILRIGLVRWGWVGADKQGPLDHFFTALDFEHAVGGR